MKNRLLSYAIWLIIFSALCLILLSVFWLVYPYKTVEVNDFKTTKIEYNAGEIVTYTFI